jgi:hypothetical protein
MLDPDPDSMNPDSQLCILVPLVSFLRKSFHPDSEAQNAIFYISIVKSFCFFGMIINTLELLKKTNMFLVRKRPKSIFEDVHLYAEPDPASQLNRYSFCSKFVTP